MTKEWQTDTIFEEDHKFFVTIQAPSDESENFRRSSISGPAEPAGPFDSLEDAQRFEDANKKQTHDKYKVLSVPADKLESQLNALALKGWKLISVSVVSAQTGGTPMALVVLENSRLQHEAGSFVK